MKVRKQEFQAVSKKIKTLTTDQNNFNTPRRLQQIVTLTTCLDTLYCSRHLKHSHEDSDNIGIETLTTYQDNEKISSHLHSRTRDLQYNEVLAPYQDTTTYEDAENKWKYI